jgi:hypothetical protein
LYTGVAADTNFNMLFLKALDSSSRFSWRINNISTQIGNDTTSIPSQTIGLAPIVLLVNTTAASQSMDISELFLKMAG